MFCLCHIVRRDNTDTHTHTHTYILNRTCFVQYRDETRPMENRAYLCSRSASQVRQNWCFSPLWSSLPNLVYDKINFTLSVFDGIDESYKDNIVLFTIL